jgi:hypothetical protein
LSVICFATIAVFEGTFKGVVVEEEEVEEEGGLDK